MCKWRALVDASETSVAGSTTKINVSETPSNHNSSVKRCACQRFGHPATSPFHLSAPLAIVKVPLYQP